MQYKIEHFPKYKDFDKSNMSVDQNNIREKSVVKTYKYMEYLTCRSCNKDHPIKEYYVKDKHTGRRSTKCRDCTMKHSGVIEIGKQRFSLKIADKGFRRCSVCKTIKPFSEYKKNKAQYLGISNNCYDCSKELLGDFQRLQRESLSDFYVKQYAKTKGVVELNDLAMAELRNEIIENRKERIRDKYFIDNICFKTIESFSDYVSKKYNINKSTVIYRISSGYTELECLIPEFDIRSASNSKGKIKVVDCVNGAEFIFRNTRDPELKKMFSQKTIQDGIKSKNPVGGKRSKYKNPCLIERIL